MTPHRSRIHRVLGAMLGIAAASAVLFASPDVQPRARTWFVATWGNDSDPGTEQQPFATIQRAADLVLPGDIVSVDDGVYTGVGTGTPCAPQTRPIVCVTEGGLATAPVTFRARNRRRARLDGRNNTSTDGFRLMAGVSAVRIEGFEIYGIGNVSGSSSGIELFNGGNGSVIVDNDIHDVGRLCTHTPNGQVGIFVEQPNVTILQNRIHDIGRYMIGENGCTTGYNASTDHGVYVNGNRSLAIPGADNVVIDGNVFYANKRGWAVQIYAGIVMRPHIVNNTFAYPNPYQDGFIVVGAPTVDGLIESNTFFSPRTAAIYYYQGAQTRLLVHNNTIAGGDVMTAVPSGVILDGNRTVAPLPVALP